MIPRRFRAAASAILVAIMLTSLLTPIALADSHHDDSYVVVQGDRCVPVEPVTGDETVEAFYDYERPTADDGNRSHPRWGRTFSSRGTEEYQRDDTSTLLLYDGPDGLSLVALHDRVHDEQENGTYGGSATFYVSGLPDDGEWAVIDDSYGWESDADDVDDLHWVDDDNAPENYEVPNAVPPENVEEYDAVLSWVWSNGRNDGAVFRGLDDETTVTIEPAFNRDSYHRYGDDRRDGPNDNPRASETYNGAIDSWEVVSVTDDGIERTSLDLDEPIRLQQGTCGPDLRLVSVEFEPTEMEVGENVTVNATVVNDGLGDGEYQATFSVEDSVVERKNVTVPAGERRTVEFSQRFTSPAEYRIGVDGESETLVVTGDSDDTDSDVEETETTESEAPGYGLVTTLVALVSTLAALSTNARRR